MELHYWEKQLILYTKGHFERKNYDKDLKYFVAELYGLYPEQVELYNILGMVVRLYQKLIDNRHIHFTLEKFIDENFRMAFRERDKFEINHHILLGQMLAEISMVAVLDNDKNRVLELGNIDEKINNIIKLEIENEVIMFTCRSGLYLYENGRNFSVWGIDQSNKGDIKILVNKDDLLFEEENKTWNVKNIESVAIIK